MKSTVRYLLFTALAILAGCASTSRAEPQTVPPALDRVRFERGIAVEEVRLAPSVAADLSEAERAVLASRLRVALVDGLSRHTVTGTPGPGALRLQVTVTEIDTTSPAVNVISSSLVFVPVDRGGIAFEARFYDGEDAAPLAITTQRHKGSMLDVKGNFSHYGHAIHALGKWGESLAQALQET